MWAVLAPDCSPLTSAQCAHINMYSASKILISQLILFLFRVILLLRLLYFFNSRCTNSWTSTDALWWMILIRMTLMPTMTTKDETTYHTIEGSFFFGEYPSKRCWKTQFISQKLKYHRNNNQLVRSCVILRTIWISAVRSNWWLQLTAFEFE